jgi:hypothetical protein
MFWMVVALFAFVWLLRSASGSNETVHSPPADGRPYRPAHRDR